MDDETQVTLDGGTTGEVAEPTEAVTIPDAEPGAVTSAAGEGEPKPAADDRPAWVKALDEAPAEDLRKHPKFHGIIGSELEQRRSQWEADYQARNQAEADQRAQEAAQQELVRMAKDNPVAFAEKFLADWDQNEVQTQLRKIESSTQANLAKVIGSSLREVPEWAELTAEDHQEFFKALAGVPNEKVLGVFNAKALERISTVKATKLHAQWRERDLAKEREAIETDVTARLLQQDGRPDIGRVRGAGVIDDEPDWRTRPAEWDRWYARQNARSR